MSDASRSALADALEARARARLVASAADVEAAIDRMAAAIVARLADRCPVVLPIMHGGAFTAVALCKRFRFPYEFDYVHVSSYRRELTGGALEWRARPHAELRGRSVLLVDDVLDRGTTLAAVRAELDALGAVDVHTAVLVVKQLADAPDRPRVDFVGLTTGDAYLFGCGMDYKGYWRGLPELYAAANG